MADVPTAPRPRTTTRDPRQLRQRLDTWLGRRLPGAHVRGLTIPAANGMSSETVLFDLATPHHTGRARQFIRPCVLRLAPPADAYAVFPHYDMARQYDTMRVVAAHTDVPVPALLWLEPDPEPLGAPFFVMERAPGHVPPDVMPYTYGDNWLHDATAADRDRLEHTTVAVLAVLHTVPGGPDGPVPFLGSGLLRDHVEAQRAYYAWVVEGVPRSPLIERAFEHLERNWPRDLGAPVLSWGDARIGNILYADFQPTAVLDWEMAGAGPRELDLGWLIYLHRFFQDLTESSGLPGLPGFLDRARVAARYAELTGHTPRDLDFFTLYAALRHAIVMLRVGHRAIRFAERALPDDPDDLIMHRDALERMLAGRYWPA